MLPTPVNEHSDSSASPSDRTSGGRRSGGGLASFSSIFAPAPDGNNAGDGHNGVYASRSADDDEYIGGTRAYRPSLPTTPTMKHSMSSSVLEMGMEWRQSVKKPLTYRLGSSTIRFQKPLVAAMLVILFAVIFLFYMAASGRKSHSSSSLYRDDHAHDGLSSLLSVRPYNATYPLTLPTITTKGMKYRIALIADLDQDSKLDTDKDVWSSYYKQGFLYYENGDVNLEWDDGEPTEVKAAMALGGRGMELSELIAFNGKLYTVDDRTGVVYQLHNGKVFPWVVLADGNGQETKGFKSEWCAVKDEHLYVGGLGKEWTTPDGVVLNFNPMYVKRISRFGEVEHVNWHDEFVKMRESAGITFPGYMIHESAAWSQEHKRWFFLPRRASKNKYNDVDDERHGTNMLIEADEFFTDVKVKRVGDLEHPSHGFSSFKFVPETRDNVIVALKSEELEGKIASYIMVFKVDGTILYPETKIGDHKYEGIEFV